MNTYAMTIPAGFLIDTDTAVAVNLHFLCREEPENVPDGLLDEISANGLWPAVKAGLVPSGLLEELGDVQLAMENLEGTADCVFASEFTGTARTLEQGKDGEPLETWDYEDDFVAAIESDKEVGPFSRAYEDIDGLAAEFKAKLQGILGPDYPYKSRAVSVLGTYFC